MALDSRNLQSQLEQVMGQLNQYTPANPSDIYQELVNRVGGFEPQYRELRGLEAQAQAMVPAQIEGMNQQYGTQGGPMSMTRLSNVFRNLSQVQGTRDVVADIINSLQGNLRGLSESALGQYNAGRQALTDRYSILNQQYQTALAQEEARRARAAQAAMMGGYSNQQQYGQDNLVARGYVQNGGGPAAQSWQSQAAKNVAVGIPSILNTAGVLPMPIGSAVSGYLTGGAKGAAKGFLGQGGYDVFKAAYNKLGRPGGF